MAVKASVTITISKYRDADSITRFYLLQASTAAAPAKPTTLVPPTIQSAVEGWVDTEPNYVSGSTNTLYFVDRSVFSDGTFEYSNVSKSSSYEAAKEAYNKAQAAQNTANDTKEELDNLEIGGRNYLLDTKEFKKWNLITSTNAQFNIVEDSENDISIHASASGLSAARIISAKPYNRIPINLVDNKTIIVGVDVKIDDYEQWDNKAYCILEGYEEDDYSKRIVWKDIIITANYSNINKIYDANKLENNEWTRVYLTFTVSNSLFSGFSSGKTYSDVTYFGVRFTLFQNGGISFRKPKIEIGNKPTDWTPAPEDIENELDNYKAESEVIVGTQTTSTANWTGNANFKELKDGQQIIYWLPVNTPSSTNVTLNLTLPDGTKTGAKNVYYGGTTRLQSHYNAGNAIRLIYRENISINNSSTKYTGWWSDANWVDGNNTNLLRFQQSIKAKALIIAGQLIVGTVSGYEKIKTGVTFDLDKPILWAGSNLGVNGTGTNNFIVRPDVNVRQTLMTLTTTQPSDWSTNYKDYCTSSSGSFVHITGDTAPTWQANKYYKEDYTNCGTWTGTQYETIYLVGTLNGNMFTVDSTFPFTTTKPTTEDGKYYISLGYMYSTYQMILYPEHPIYRFVNGVFKNIAQLAYEAKTDIDNLEVGGRNLLLGSKTLDTSKGNYRNGMSAITEIYNNCIVCKSTGAWSDIGFDLKRLINNNIIKAGDILTYSLLAKTDDNVDRSLRFYLTGSKDYTAKYVNSIHSYHILDEYGWTRYYANFEITEEMINDTSSSMPTRIECTTSCTSGKFIYWTCPKLEKGNKPTDWTPAPEDIDEAIAKTVKQVDVEYYLSTDPSTPTGGSWVTTAPAWENGKYMWSRQKVTYVDGTTATRNATCIAGAKGDTGLDAMYGLPDILPITRWSFDNILTNINNITYFPENNETSNFITQKGTIVSNNGKAIFNGTQVVRSNNIIDFNNNITISFWLSLSELGICHTILQSRKVLGKRIFYIYINRK